MANQDFRDLFAELNAAHVEYLVVEAHALAVHGHIRATKDLDVWVRASPENAVRVLKALASFGAPTHQLSVEDLSRPGLTFQMGVPPLRIDILKDTTEAYDVSGRILAVRDALEGPESQKPLQPRDTAPLTN